MFGGAGYSSSSPLKLMVLCLFLAGTLVLSSAAGIQTCLVGSVYPDAI
jgi:hypothetical protein